MYTKYLIIEKKDLLKATIIEKTKRGNIKQEVEISSLYLLLEQLNKDPRYVKGLKIKGNDLFFTTNDLLVEVKDYKKLKSDKTFSFLFNFLNNKKYKVIRNVVIKGTACALTSILALNAFSSFETSNSDIKQETTTAVNQEQKEVIEKVVAQVPMIEEQIKTEVTIEENTTIYDELGVGTRSNDAKAIKAKELYYSKIQKYAKKYGLDPDIICAIATQERGIHSSVRDGGGAIGLMQIQVSVWHDKTIEVFDYEENKTKMIYITEEKLEDVDFNIEVGCAVFQDCLNHMKGNVIAALQSYNTGPYAVDDIIRKYCNVSGKTKKQILQENDLNWLDYRTSDYNGDPDYVEHVLSYFNGDISNLQLKNSGTSIK